MARFFVEHLPDSGVEYTLTGENAEHAKVLRLRAGEEVTLCDGRGMECPCRVEAGLTLRAGAPLPSPAEPKVRAALYLAFPKADKAEHVIQKATELGAAKIVLFPSRYCVSRPDDTSLAKKLDRWQKIARSAAEQSRRGVIPAVRALDSYGQAIAEAAQAELPVLFYENEEQLTLREALAEIGTPPHPSPAATPSPQGEGFVAAPTVSLMTGAEGGFSEEEIAQARAAGLKICTLGPRILRCETAPLAGLTAVMYALGEI
ncbi:MAG: 16S rRNA (uracil(1498)-N(3))-methyltransferase [Oscillospiraceae bacterium]|nr:16S rRNA (uracil(1498)-N(3))-methyltransferase [Oscillospiraceae bacterium]